MEPWGAQMSRHGMSTEQASKVKLKGHQREKEFNNKDKGNIKEFEKGKHLIG